MRCFFVICVFITALVGYVTADCSQNVSACAVNAGNRQADGFAKFNFTEVCRALADSDACYINDEQRPECRNYSSTIENLKNIAEKSASLWCNGRQPNKCLAGIQDCYMKYKSLLQSAAPKPVATCMVVKDCLQNLTCPRGEGGGDVANALERLISANATSTHCAGATPGGGNSTCVTQARECVEPVEAEVLQYEKAFDFDGLCSIWTGVQDCYTKLYNNPSCQYEKETLNITWATFSQRYSLYCTNDGKARPCLEALRSCTLRFTKVQAMPQFKGDALYQCRGTEDLVQCWNQLKNMSCPPDLMNSLGGLTHQHKIEATLQHNCGAVLTPCTYEASECVVKEVLSMEEASNAANYNRICQIFIDQEKCVSPHLRRPECSQNSALLNERKYSREESAFFCNASSPDQAKTCLQDTWRCTAPYEGTLKHHPDGDGLKCSDLKSLVTCMKDITCSDNSEKLQNATAGLRGTFQKQASIVCAAPAVYPAATVVFTFTLLCLVKILL